MVKISGKCQESKNVREVKMSGRLNCQTVENKMTVGDEITARDEITIGTK